MLLRDYILVEQGKPVHWLQVDQNQERIVLPLKWEIECRLWDEDTHQLSNAHVVSRSASRTEALMLLNLLITPGDNHARPQEALQHADLDGVACS